MPLIKVRLEEHRKAVYQGEIEKSGMTDHIWKEKGNHLLSWDQAKIIAWEERSKISRLKEAKKCSETTKRNINVQCTQFPNL